MFMLALLALHHQFGQHHVLHSVFNPQAHSNSQLSPELQAYNSVVLINLGNTLHHLNCVDTINKWDTNKGTLDEAMDVYHHVLADRPGDPVATDLLTLALELSMCSVHVDPEQDEFALRSLDEIGLLTLETIGSPSNASSDEDSDEAMDIEEDSD
ncbi:hypothetical protein EV181_002617 [Coemansia sp. RSA 532]|nr:hypothetical protein EV181_002617 [Coemansia sp. RSA 532]KAJ2288748.1 hypothetical protein IW141_004208 [Coemansia sp. RSA 355]